MRDDLRATQDTSVNSAVPNANYGGYTALGIGSSPTRYAFIYFPKTFPLGASIASAILSIWVRGPWQGGSQTVTVRRISTPWKESGAGSITYNVQPSVAGASATASVTTGAFRIDIDVTAIMAEVASGNPFYGFRIAADGTFNNIHSGEAVLGSEHPELVVVWSSAPGEPTSLHPGGGRLCSIAQPTFTWHFNDADGDPQSAYYFQLSANSDMSSPAVDTGWVTDPNQEKVLTEVSLADGDTRYWRVKTKDDSGVESPWSDIQEFSRDTKGTVAITDPTTTVEDATPPITHSFSGETQAVVQYLLEEQDPDDLTWALVYDSGRRATTATTFTLPAGHITDPGANYRITVRVWDNKARESTPGDVSYVEDSQEFTFAYTGAAAPVLTLVATIDDSPAVTLTWTRANTPDFFSLTVDGKVVNARIDPEDVRIDATTYSMRVWELDPAVNHTVEIQPVVLSGGLYLHTSGNPTISVNTEPRDCWLAVPAKNIHVRILTEQTADYGVGQESATFFPENRRDPVVIEEAIRGLEGTVEGTVSSKADRATFENIKSWAHVGQRVVMIHGDRQFPIALGEITRDVPLPGSDNDWHDVGFRFWQIGNFFVRQR